MMPVDVSSGRIALRVVGLVAGAAVFLVWTLVVLWLVMMGHGMHGRSSTLLDVVAWLLPGALAGGILAFLIDQLPAAGRAVARAGREAVRRMKAPGEPPVVRCRRCGASHPSRHYLKDQGCVACSKGAR